MLKCDIDGWIYGDFVEAALARKNGTQEIETKDRKVKLDWLRLGDIAGFFPQQDYRWRVTASVPLRFTYQPLSVKPQKGTEYYYIQPWSYQGYTCAIWDNDPLDNYAFDSKLAFASEEAIRDFLAQVKNANKI